MKTTTSRVDVVISVDSGSLSRIEDVAEELRTSGLSVKKIMPAIGTITGSVEETRMGKLRSVRGIVAVEVSREYRVPPPQSNIQ